jgi:hypothetical protein
MCGKFLLYEGDNMYNYTIWRFACGGVFRWFFCAGTCCGGVGGIVIGLLDGGLVGIWGGMFLGFVFGLISGLMGAGYAAVFNKLAPLLGGLSVSVELRPVSQADGAATPAVREALPAGNSEKRCGSINLPYQ